jgi:wobble nucleotide-excising tRNase
MQDLRSLRAEIDNLNHQAKAAHDDAANARMKAASHTAGGDTAKAQWENNAALKRDNEAIDYQNKASQLEKQATNMQQEAEMLQKQITDLQQKLANITGDSPSSII